MNRLITVCLLPLSWVFGFAVIVRNLFYDAGILPATRIRTPVISVGNLTTGGTGKTPFTEYLVRHFLKAGKSVAVLSRGYRRASKGTLIVSDGKTLTADPAAAGDEPFQIASKFPGIVVVVDESRARAAKLVEERFRTDMVILDDGFQHRKLERSADIVMVDGDSRLRAMPLLPAGRRREPMSSLRRADFLVFTGNPPGNPEEFSGARLPYAVAHRRLSGFRRIGGPESPERPELLRGKRVLAVCGIAVPAGFRETLEGAGAVVAGLIAYPDHHRYTAPDVEDILRRTETPGVEALVTTEKDAVRLLPFAGRLRTAPVTVFAAMIELSIVEGEHRLDALLRDTVS